MSIYNGTNKVCPLGLSKIYVGENLVWKSARLPSAYQEVEWIKTTQGGFINTQILPQFYDICDAKFMIHSVSNASYVPTLSAYQHAYLMYSTSYGATANTAKACNTWSVWDAKADAGNTISNFANNIRHHYAYAKNGYRYVQDVDTGTTIFINDYSSVESASNVVPYAIFGRANSGSTTSSMTISYPTEQTLYSLKLWRGNSDGEKTSLVRDYVPCYRISDNVIGLYDLVSGTFFTDGASTNHFTKGPDVN